MKKAKKSSSSEIKNRHRVFLMESSKIKILISWATASKKNKEILIFCVFSLLWSQKKTSTKENVVGLFFSFNITFVFLKYQKKITD